MIASDKYSKYKWDEIFYMDSSSPTGLRWKIPIFSGKSHGKIIIAQGTPAGIPTTRKGKSYYVINFNNEKFYGHRILMILLVGDFDQSLVVNHIDGNGLNNSVENLELCTQSKNNMLRKQSTERSIKGKTQTGFVGVSLINSHGKLWMFRATWRGIDGKKKAKEFSIDKYGYNVALELAIKSRSDGNEELMTYFEKERENAKHLCD